MRTASANHHVYTFGEFTLDTNRSALLRGDKEIKLRPKSFEVLRHLVERHGELVGKDELFAAIWGRTVVSNDSLTQCLIDARKAIDDPSRHAIRTVPRRGYVFTPEVHELGTPQGAELPVDSDGIGRRRLAWLTGTIAILTIVLATLLAGRYFTGIELRPDTVAGLAAKSPTIAVLPFVDMSQEGDNQYFSDGVAEEILGLLAGSPDLRVTARASSFSFRGDNPDIATVAEKLGVAYILEGSVRRSGNRVRVTAQLIDASSGLHVWSHSYDRQFGDMLDVQTEIAAAVASSLQVTLVDEVADAGDAGIAIEAYGPFLQAQFLYNRRLPGDLDRARDNYRKTLNAQPDYAPAWAGIAGTYFVQTVGGELPPEVGWPKMRDAVTRALALDPRLAEAHVRADQYHTYTGDQESAAEHRHKAMLYGPNNSLVLSRMAGSAAMRGHFDKAVELQRRAVALDPLAVVSRMNLASFLRAAGRFDDAREQFLSALALNPEMTPQLERELAFLLILQDRLDEALAEIQEWPGGPDKEQALALVYYAMDNEREANAALTNLMERPGSDTVVRIAEVYAYRGDIDEAFRWLETPHEHILAMEHSSYDKWIEDICLSPFLRPLHSDPRWGRLMS